MREASWSYVPAREVFSLSSGLPYADASPDPSGHVPIYGSSGFAGYGKKTLTSGAAIVIGRVGEGGVGSVHYVEGETWITDNALWTDQINSRWLPQFVASYLSWSDLRRLRSQTGQPLITQKIIRSVPIPEIPLAEQRRIAEILDSADRLIEYEQSTLLKRRLLATALAETFMREASIYPPHQLHSIAESAVDGPFGSNLKSEHYVEMPGTRVVRLQNIGTGEFLDNDQAYVENRHAAALASHDVRGGDLLAASLGDERHPIARACIYPIRLSPGIVKADCFRIRLNPLMATSYYVMRALNSSMLARAIKAATQGVTRDRINLRSLLSVSLPVPPLSFQNDMKATIEAEVEVMHATERVIAKLRVEKRGLMDDLLTGRVRVTV